MGRKKEIYRDVQFFHGALQLSDENYVKNTAEKKMSLCGQPLAVILRTQPEQTSENTYETERLQHTQLGCSEKPITNIETRSYKPRINERTGQPGLVAFMTSDQEDGFCSAC